MKHEYVLSGIVVELHVPDFRPAIDFYSLLGFSVVWGQSGKKGYLVMKSGPNILNFYCGTQEVFNHSYFRNLPPDTPRGYAVEIVIPVDDVHALYDKISQINKKGLFGGKIVEDLKLKPWGKYDFRMVDPFGFYIRICEPDNWLVP